MRASRVLQLLACLNSHESETAHRTGWVVATCPFAPWTHGAGIDKNPSFGVNLPGSGKTQIYNCFSCGEAGALDDLVFDVREHYRKKPDVRYQIGQALAVLVADADEEIEIDIPDYDEPVDDPMEVKVWPEYFVESFKSVFAHPEAVQYLKTREITQKVTKELDLRYDTSRQRVCFPIRDWDRKLVGLHGRHVGDHPLPYFAYGFEGRRNKMPWYGEEWMDPQRIVVITESVFDLASIRRVYDNVICPLSSGFSKEKLRRIDGGLSYVTLFDQGTGGDRARERIDQVMQSDFQHELPPDHRKDAGEMTEKEVVKVLSKYGLTN